VSPEGILAAARLLIEARQSRRPLPRLPEALTPETSDEGYAIQREVIRLQGDRIVGWKVGCTGPEAQRKARASEPFRGPVLAGDLYRSGTRLPRAAYFTCSLQVEFALVLGRGIAPGDGPHSARSLRDIVTAVRPALEVADSRFVDPALVYAPSQIADSGKAGVLVLGDAACALDEIDLPQAPVTLSVNGREVAAGRGGNVMGDPLNSLAWLVNDLGRRGEALEAGQFVSTGTCTGNVLAHPGDVVVADYGVLGQVTLELEPIAERAA